MKAHIHFIPWVVNLEHNSKSHNWQTQAIFLGKKKFYHVVNYSGIINPLLYFVTDGEIFIRGHGTESDPELSPGVGTIGGALRYDAVADRLIRTGLKKRFSGKIKLWNCESGLGGENSFSKQFADHMRSEGYNQCLYFGYKGTLFPFYFDRGQGLHRYGTDENGRDVRASQMRIQV